MWVLREGLDSTFLTGPLCCSRSVKGGSSVKRKCVRDSGAENEEGKYKKGRLYLY